MTPDESILTISELSELLKVPKKTIYDWVHKGEIPYLKVGRHLRFQGDKVLKYFETLTEQNKPDPSCWDPFLALKFPNVSRSLKIGYANRAGSRKE